VTKRRLRLAPEELAEEVRAVYGEEAERLVRMVLPLAERNGRGRVVAYDDGGKALWIALDSGALADLLEALADEATRLAGELRGGSQGRGRRG
jgi:hypothetical protein